MRAGTPAAWVVYPRLGAGVTPPPLGPMTPQTRRRASAGPPPPLGELLVITKECTVPCSDCRWASVAFRTLPAG